MKILDYLFENHTCLVCGHELNAPQNVYLCDKCAKSLPLNTEPLALVDKTQKQYFTRGVAPFAYAEPIRSLILSLKYSQNGHVPAMLAPYMAGIAKSQKIFTPDAILVPVPLCKSRQKQRGYNQATLLAREIAKYTNHVVDDKILIRTKKTEINKNKSVKERAENLKNAFEVSKEGSASGGCVKCSPIPDPSGKHYIIIDDVFTSGATVNECARTLVQSGARRVDVIVASKLQSLVDTDGALNAPTP